MVALNLADVSIDIVTGKYVLRIGKITTKSYSYQLNDPFERYCYNRQDDMLIEFTEETLWDNRGDLENELINMDYGDIWIFTKFIKEYEDFRAYVGAYEFIDKVLKDL